MKTKACVQCVVLTVVALLAVMPVAAGTLLDEANSAFDMGNYDRASLLYAQFVRDNPQAQQPAARYAMALHALGQYDDAIMEARQANEIATYEPAHAQGLLCLAKSCSVVGCLDEARMACAQLSELYPTSPEAAEAAFVSSTIDGVAADVAQATLSASRTDRLRLQAIVGDLDRQQFQHQLRVAIHSKIESEGDAQLADALSELINSLPNGPTRLEARRLHLQVLAEVGDDLSQVVAHMEELYADAVTDYPVSLLARQVGFALAMVYIQLDRADDAVSQYQAVADLATAPEQRAKCLLDAAFDVFEYVSVNMSKKRHTIGPEYAVIHSLCERVGSNPDASSWMSAQAMRLQIFSYTLARKSSPLISEATRFIDMYDDASWLHTHDKAQVHILLGEALAKQGRHEEALPNFLWVTDRYEAGEDVLLPQAPPESAGRILTVARAYYKAFRARQYGRLGSVHEWRALGDKLVHEFPDCHYTFFVQMALEEQ